MVNSYFYSNIAVPTTLSGNINNSVTSATVASTTGWPSSFPYIVALDYGTASEELVRVTANAAGTLTISRAFGGTSAVSHSTGAAVRHVYNAQDATDFRTHEQATAAAHGIAGSFVGTTDTQTLTNKTLTSPTINTASIAGATLSGTLAGSPTFSGNPAFTGTPTFVASSHSGTTTHTGIIQSNQSGSGNVTLATIVTADTFDRWRVYASGLQEWGAGNLARDTNLYRGAADILQTDDNFRSQRSAAANTALSARVSGDSVDRHVTLADGKHSWGSGSGAVDVSLYRQSAGYLQTDGTLEVLGDFFVGGYGQQLFTWKTADTARTTATLADDPHLTSSLAANATYRMQGTLFFYTTDESTADLALGFSVPSGATGRWTAFAQGGGSPSANAGLIRTASQDYATTRTYDAMLQATVTLGLMFNGLVVTTNAGTFAAQWARSAGSGTVTLLQNSWMSLQRVD